MAIQIVGYFETLKICSSTSVTTISNFLIHYYEQNAIFDIIQDSETVWSDDFFHGIVLYNGFDSSPTFLVQQICSRNQDNVNTNFHTKFIINVLFF